MAVIPVPTLSTSGWVSSVSAKIDTLLSHYFCSDKFQTSLYGKNVSNFQWTLQQHTENPYTFAEALQSELITYLSRYYESVTVDAKAVDEDPNKPGTRMNIVLIIYFKEQNIEYSAQKQISTLDGKLKSFTDLNNLQQAN